MGDAPSRCHRRRSGRAVRIGGCRNQQIAVVDHARGRRIAERRLPDAADIGQGKGRSIGRQRVGGAGADRGIGFAGHHDRTIVDDPRQRRTGRAERVDDSVIGDVEEVPLQVAPTRHFLADLGAMLAKVQIDIAEVERRFGEVLGSGALPDAFGEGGRAGAIVAHRGRRGASSSWSIR